MKSIILSPINDKDKQEMLVSLAKARPSEFSEEAINEISNSNFSGLLNIVLAESLKTDDEIEQEMLKRTYPSCAPDSERYAYKNEKQVKDIPESSIRTEYARLFPFYRSMGEGIEK